MSAGLRQIDSVSAIAADTTNRLVVSPGGHSSASFYFDCSAIGAGDTWQVILKWTAPSGNKIIIAQSATFTTTGLKAVALVSPFTLANAAVPTPTEVLYDNSVNGGAIALTGTLHDFYGD